MFFFLAFLVLLFVLVFFLIFVLCRALVVFVVHVVFGPPFLLSLSSSSSLSSCRFRRRHLNCRHRIGRPCPCPRPRMPRPLVIFFVACLRLRARPHLLPCPRPLLCTRPCPRLRVRPLIRIAVFFVIPFSAVTVAIAVILSLTSLCPMFLQMIIVESIGEHLDGFESTPTCSVPEPLSRVICSGSETAFKAILYIQ